MNHIVTIADKKYLQYVSRLHASVRRAGWRGEFVILTTENDIYCNCTVKKIERKNKTIHFNDNRWLQFDILRYFDKWDKVLYLDADMIALPDCDFDFMFDNDFLLSIMPIEGYDVTNELPDMKKVLGFEVDFKYIMAPAVFTVGDPTAEKLFSNAIEAMPLAEKYKRGSLFALNISAYRLDNFRPMLFPNEKVVYSLDIKAGRRFASPWFVHYGGNVGKKQWEDEYKGLDLGYML